MVEIFEGGLEGNQSEYVACEYFPQTGVVGAIGEQPEDRSFELQLLE